MAKKRLIGFGLAALFLMSAAASAYAETLVPGGSALGIKMSSDGVIVAELQRVGETSPAEKAGIKKGDVIVSVGGAEIHSAEDFLKAADSLSGGEVRLGILRDGKTQTVTVIPEMTDSGLKLGLALKDGIGGVGTLTFFDPESGIYGALGHSIADENGEVIPLGDGSVFSAQIISIDRGEAGAPGALNGYVQEGRELGDIGKNCDCGIFGKGSFDGDTLETGMMHTGSASILCTLDEGGVLDYGIEIRKVSSCGDRTTAVITVTDSRLLDKTGGIVQGMSGSPIIQDGLLVGAVTHVFVNDPTSGYAIAIGDMLKSARSLEPAA